MPPRTIAARYAGCDWKRRTQASRFDSEVLALDGGPFQLGRGSGPAQRGQDFGIVRFGLVGHPEQYAIRQANAVVDVGEYLQVRAQARLELPREVLRLGCHDCEGRADALELIVRGPEGVQLSGAERRPAASEETQDEGSVAAQLLGGVETAVGVWQEEIWRGVSDLQRVRRACIAQPAHEVAV